MTAKAVGGGGRSEGVSLFDEDHANTQVLEKRPPIASPSVTQRVA